MAETKHLTGWGLRWALSGSLLLLGLFQVPFLGPGFWWITPKGFSKFGAIPLPSRFLLAAVLLSAIFAAIALSWSAFRDEVQQTLQSDSPIDSRWVVCTIAYSVVIALLVHLEVQGRGDPSLDLRSTVVGILTLTALISWPPTLMPVPFWLRWGRRSVWALMTGAVVGIVSYIVGAHYTAHLPRFIELIHRPTLWTVYFLLRLFGQQVTFDPADYLIGTPHFLAQVSSACSGREGIGLFLTFFGMYLWFCRRELRFPHALLLLPIGICVLWLLNGVRIALLIIIGGWSSALAIEGFHSVAGWVFFIALTLILVVISQSSSTFARAHHARRSSPNPAAPYLVPLIMIIITAMAARLFFYRFDVLYPLRVMAGAAALWLYRRTLAVHRWRFSWPAIGLGVMAFIMWLALGHIQNIAAADASFRRGLAHLSVIGSGPWLVFRLIGAILIVPVAEELAFRGYLLRKLISADFETIGAPQFTWASFLGSSVLFGALHSQWLAGTFAGMLFALALYRQGHISDAIASHATTNGLLSLYVLTSGHWALWG